MSYETYVSDTPSVMCKVRMCNAQKLSDANLLLALFI